MRSRPKWFTQQDYFIKWMTYRRGKYTFLLAERAVCNSHTHTNRKKNVVSITDIDINQPVKLCRFKL